MAHLTYPSDQHRLRAGDLVLDEARWTVHRGGREIGLSPTEFRLLAYLMHHTGRVVSRTELVEHLYDQDFDRDSNTIEVFVGRLRKKLGVDAIQTVRGLGYLVPTSAEQAEKVDAGEPGPNGKPRSTQVPLLVSPDACPSDAEHVCDEPPEIVT